MQIVHAGINDADIDALTINTRCFQRASRPNVRNAVVQVSFKNQDRMHFFNAGKSQEFFLRTSTALNLQTVEHFLIAVEHLNRSILKHLQQSGLF